MAVVGPKGAGRKEGSPAGSAARTGYAMALGAVALCRHGPIPQHKPAQNPSAHRR